MTISLLISTYNSPKALNLCLESIMRQTKKPDEVLIADDGSTDDTREVIDKYAAILSMPVKHVWHEDKGFRAGAIRNKAIAASVCEYIVQIDGDIIMDAHFIEDHVRYAEEGYFCSGSRAMISASRTRKALEEGHYIPSVLSQGIKARENAIRLTWLTPLVHSLHKDNRINGCSMSYWRKDALNINGYDESFVGWGAEDNDFSDRLKRSGLKQRHLKFSAIQYHLYHKENSRASLSRNKEILKENERNNIIRCKNGIVQL